MPEIKNTFTGGKMNKDLDERLVPKGEYIDAMNVQVSTSENSDVGTVQNILGNSLGCPSDFLPVNSFTVGSISDESNDNLYWMVSGDPFGDSAANLSQNISLQAPINLSDQIVRKTTDGCERVFVDKYGFSAVNTSTNDDNIIEGISTEIFNQIQVGAEVTGVDSFGNSSNTASVTAISTPDPYDVIFDADPSSSNVTQTFFADPNVNPAVKIGNKILIPALMGDGASPIPSASTNWSAAADFVYITNFTGTLNGLIGETINLFYNDNALSQTYQITNATNANLTIAGLGIPAVKVTLDNNLPINLANSLNNPSPSTWGVSSPTHLFETYGSNQNNIVASITQTVAVNNNLFNGNIYFYDYNTGNISYDVNNFAVGDIINIVPISNQVGGLLNCKINNINPVDNSVTVEDLNGNPVTPFQIGGFINGVAVPEYGQILIPGENKVFLNTDLILSSGFENGLSSYQALLFKNPRVLNYQHGQIITGINIVDDMLFWTDNRTEPKKININSSIEGTIQYPFPLNQTRLINPSQSIGYADNVPVEEKHITVIKTPPMYAPALEMVGERLGNSYGELTEVNGNPNNDFTGIDNNSEVTLTISPSGAVPLNYEIGDILFLKSFDTEISFPITDYNVRVVITEISSSSTFICSVLSIDENFDFSSTLYGCDLDNTYDKLYKLKFPRFAFRFKYKDNEYSSFGPFSEPAFMAGDFDFKPNSGYNLGMENKLRELTIKQIVPGNIPEDVKQIDILYKESDSPNVYIVDEIKPSDQYWFDNSYKIKQETIKSLVASNQLLRAFDNVPKRALAQDVSGNRIIYGNYEQNYNLDDTRVSFTFNLKNRNIGDYKSIKSLRNYQLGVVYTDEYNRQTPVLTDLSGAKSISKIDSSSNNQIEVKLNNDPPSWATYQKFYIKEVSTKYHNLALDRYFDAEDGNIWLSFSSNDRNKIDLDTTLFLKKAYNSSAAETTLEQYRVVDVKNEAPEYIKTRKVVIGTQSNEILSDGSLPDGVTLTGNSRLFVGASDTVRSGEDPVFENGLPVEGQDTIYLNANIMRRTLLDNFHKRHNSPDADRKFDTSNSVGGGGGQSINSPLYIKIKAKTVGFETVDETNWYEVDSVVRTEVTGDSGFDDRPLGEENKYIIKLKKKLGDDALFTYDRDANPAGINGNPNLLRNISTGNQPTNVDSVRELRGGGGYSSYLVLEIAQEIVQNRSVFQGRFFVKILRDEYIDRVIVQPGIEDYRVVAKAECGYIKDYSYEVPGFAAGLTTPFGGSALAAKISHNATVNHINNNGFNGVAPTAHTNTASIYNNPSALSGTFGSSNFSWFYPNPAVNAGTWSHDEKPETPYDENVYWGHATWRRINNQLNDLDSKSRWVIDEAFAAGEEQLWDRHGFNKKYETAYQDPSFVGNAYNTPRSGSVNYSGYNYLSSNKTSISHQRNSTWENYPGYNGGYGNGLGKGDDTSIYNYHTTGNGITDFTIDLSYISTGKNYKSISNGYGAGPLVKDFHEEDFSEISMSSALMNNLEGRFINPNYNVEPGNLGDNWQDYFKIKGTHHSSVELEADIFAKQLIPGKFLRFTNDPNKIVYEITDVKKIYKINYAEALHDKNEYPGFNLDLTDSQGNSVNDPTASDYLTRVKLAEVWQNYAHFNRRITYRITLRAPDGGVIGTDGAGAIGYDPIANPRALASPTAADKLSISNTYVDADSNTRAVNCPIEIVQKEFIINDNDTEFPEDPAVFETEPKDSADLNIFHEISDTLPIIFTKTSGYNFAPVGSVVTTTEVGSFPNPILQASSSEPAKVISWSDNIVKLDSEVVQDYISVSNIIKFSRPDGSYTTAKFAGLIDAETNSLVIPSTGATATVTHSKSFRVNPNIKNNTYGLGWHNCYSFGNGVESSSIRDAFNSPSIDKGPRASTTLEEGYEVEQRKYGLIYSGIYNSNSGVNNLNQFVQAENITKEINPSYGSIQKLHAGWGQNGDLLALCEDRVLKILANKDALFNADGSTNLTATKNVLGSATPYSSEFGISKNPESFASESFRAYFTDKVRGKVIRLSRDGLTPISDAGMSDWFKDNLKISRTLFGSYDDKKGEYNITLQGDDISKTISYKENVRGWVSFKSFVPENAISCANEYYTFLNGKVWKHHDESVDRNTFYGVFNNSTVTASLNDAPGIVKSFNTLNYEGSNSKINFNVADEEYINLTSRDGWYVDNIHTDLEKGSVNDFIDKEGKWFSYLKGKDVAVAGDMSVIINNDNSSLFDQSSFAIQGLGILNNTSSPSAVFGCTDITALNYNSLATIDDGSCLTGNIGCTDVTAHNYDPVLAPTVEDGSCEWYGCTDPNSMNLTDFGGSAASYELLYPGSIIDNGSCVTANYGCTDSSAFNYDPNANIDDGSCVPIINGCVGRKNFVGQYIFATTATNYQGPGVGVANTDDGSCEFNFCSDPSDVNYDADTINQIGFSQDPATGLVTTQYNFNNPLQLVYTFCGSATYYACLDPGFSNFNAGVPANVNALPCDGGVVGCDNTPGNECTGPGTLTGQCCAGPVSSLASGCLDPNAPNGQGLGVGVSLPDCVGAIPVQQAQSGAHPNYGNTSCCQQYGCVNDDTATNYVDVTQVQNQFPVGNANAGQPTHVQGSGGCNGTGCCYDVLAYQCDVNGFVETTTLIGLDSADIMNNPQSYPNDPANNVIHPTTGTTGYWIDQTEASNYLSNNLWQGLETGDGCIGGCTQPLDCNYNSLATWDDGSCSGTYSGGITKFACINGGGSCSTIGSCHPLYNTANAYTTNAACLAGTSGCIQATVIPK